MRFLTNAEATDWCKAHGLVVKDERMLTFPDGANHCLTIEIEKLPAPRVMALANHLVPSWNEDPFRGALLWLREWGVWSDNAEKVGATLLGSLRAVHGERRPFMEVPAQYFEGPEVWEMHSGFSLSMLIGWDAFLVPEAADYFIFVCHDGVAEVVSRTSEISDGVAKRIDDWAPKPDTSWYPKRV